MIGEFIETMARYGVVTQDRIIPDGKPHYIHLVGDKRGRKAAWYVLFPEGYGSFGCFKTGIKEKWRQGKETRPDPAERQRRKAEHAAKQRAWELNEAEEKQAARAKANVIWSSVMPATNAHPYLVMKGIKNHGLKLHEGRLTIPLHDEKGILHSLQYIDAEGNKRFLSGGRKKGCFFLIGKNAKTLCIAEGYATAASIHEATGHMTAVAFDAGNLLPVALALRGLYPDAKIILCADNDAHTFANPGLTQACKAAKAVGGLVTYFKEK